MLRLQLQETAVVRKSMPGGVRGGARKESPYSIAGNRIELIAEAGSHYPPRLTRFLVEAPLSGRG